MHLALTVWNGQVATVADFAQRLRIVTLDQGRVLASRETDAPGQDAERWCARLAADGVSTLICGAITRHLHRRLDAGGVAVVGGCSGPADAVLAAWLQGTIDQSSWRRPSCGRLEGDPGAAMTVKPPSGAAAMRIAITTTAPGADAPLDPRFGRSRHVLVCSLGSAAVSDHPNPTAIAAEHGAGIRTAEFVAGLGVQAVITGAVGPKAMQVLKAAGIAAYACDGGDARSALERLRAGALTRIP